MVWLARVRRKPTPWAWPDEKVGMYWRGVGEPFAEDPREAAFFDRPCTHPKYEYPHVMDLILTDERFRKWWEENHDKIEIREGG